MPSSAYRSRAGTGLTNSSLKISYLETPIPGPKSSTSSVGPFRATVPHRPRSALLSSAVCSTAGKRSNPEYAQHSVWLPGSRYGEVVGIENSKSVGMVDWISITGATGPFCARRSDRAPPAVSKTTCLPRIPADGNRRAGSAAVPAVLERFVTVMGAAQTHLV